MTILERSPSVGRNTGPRASRRAVDPQQLENLICKEGKSLTRAAKLIGVSPNTLSVLAVRLGIPFDTRPKKIDAQTSAQLLSALKHGLPLAVIAEKLNLSMASLYRVLRMHPSEATVYRQHLLEQERQRRRERLNEQAADTAIRFCADYYWLRRNDAAWLANLTGTRHTKTSKRKRISHEH